MSLFALARPRDEDVRRFLAAQRDLPFSYPDVGATRSSPPARWTTDTYRTVLGPGRESFERARGLVRRWTMFDLGWVELLWPDAPIQVGSTVGVLVRSAGIHCLNAARVAYVIDEPDRFGFAYGTLPGHVEAGEERFLVEHTPEDLTVYSILAFSRPRAALARIAYPWTRREQRRFGRDSLAVMRRSMAP